MRLATRSVTVKGTSRHLPKLREWVTAHRTVVRTAVLLVVFLLGIVVQRAGLLGWLRQGAGLTDANLARWGAWVDQPVTAFRAAVHNSRLPTLHIDMGFEHVHTIEAKRNEALQRGFLFASDSDFVPAVIRVDTTRTRVRMRLKGDLVDHLNTAKWSFRIHTRGEDQLFGMRRFSIQHPGTRNYLPEWAWLETLRSEGVLAPRYRFVNVVFNGTPKGIYALEEHFSKELLESQERREGVIVTWDETQLWQRWDAIGQPPWLSDVVQLDGYRWAPIDVRRAGRVARDSALAAQRDAAFALMRAFQEGRRPASEVFDVPLLARFLAVTDLWQAGHALLWNNLQLYYNPITAKLEPIGFDGDPQRESMLELTAMTVDWSARALQDPDVAEAYVAELARVSAPGYLEQLRARLDARAQELHLALFHEFPAARDFRLWDLVARKQRFMRGLLDASHLVLAWAPRRPGWRRGTTDTVDVEVRVVSTLPVAVGGIRVGDTLHRLAPRWHSDASFLPDGDLLLPAAEQGALEVREPLVLRVATPWPPQDSVMPRLTVVTRILGRTEQHASPVLWYGTGVAEGPIPAAPSLNAVLAQHAFLERTDAATLRVRPGRWDVVGDLVMPEGIGLDMGPGTALQFQQGAVLLLRGGPLNLRGSREAPVELGPAGGAWGGVVVLDAGTPSSWEYARVRGTAGIDREGWSLTGGITFYGSPVVIRRSEILGSTAEDGINVLRAEVAFHETRFATFASDAFDGDFVNGIVENCRFEDAVGDALDLSGSRLIVRGSTFSRIGDKALSVGEGSRLTAEDLVVTDVGIGVASKDLSTAELRRVTIDLARHFALAAYQKKPEFGPATLTGERIELSGSAAQVAVQTGSWIRLNGQLLEGSDLDVERLYAAGILGN